MTTFKRLLLCIRLPFSKSSISTPLPYFLSYPEIPSFHYLIQSQSITLSLTYIHRPSLFFQTRRYHVTPIHLNPLSYHSHTFIFLHSSFKPINTMSLTFIHSHHFPIRVFFPFLIPSHFPISVFFLFLFLLTLLHFWPHKPIQPFPFCPVH